MEWYEWVFDGIGTTIIGAICSFIGYKAAVKKISKQSQIAGDDSKQQQEMFVDNTEGGKNVQSTIKQTQKAGDRAEQFQCGEFKSGK